MSVLGIDTDTRRARAGDVRTLSLDQLLSAARDGSISAASLVGRRLLVGRDAPFDPQEGLRHLIFASAQGDADALSQMATLKAAGAWMPQNWTEALDLLQTAAERGSERARGQLMILGDEGGGADRSWARLRASVDLRRWLSVPERRAICEAPRIRVVENFVPLAVCDWLMARGAGRYQRSMMFDGQASNVLDSRTCSDFKFDILDADVVMQIVRERIAAITTLPTVAFEPPQIFHYALGEEIKAHYDALRLGDQGYGQRGTYKGDRIATFLLYLNDDYDGGELEFPRVKVRHKGRAGDGIYFAHVDANGVPDRLSLHAALPITRNEKFILSQWIHDRPFAAVL
jgi:prolyl 4-hydroxylase